MRRTTDSLRPLRNGFFCSINVLWVPRKGTMVGWKTFGDAAGEITMPHYFLFYEMYFWSIRLLLFSSRLWFLVPLSAVKFIWCNSKSCVQVSHENNYRNIFIYIILKIVYLIVNKKNTIILFSIQITHLGWSNIIYFEVNFMLK